MKHIFCQDQISIKGVTVLDQLKMMIFFNKNILDTSKILKINYITLLYRPKFTEVLGNLISNNFFDIPSI